MRVSPSPHSVKYWFRLNLWNMAVYSCTCRKNILFLLCTLGFLSLLYLNLVSTKTNGLLWQATMVHMEPAGALSQPLSSFLDRNGVKLTPSNPVLESKMRTLQAVLTAVKSVLPPKFLPGYASPCWYANYTVAKADILKGSTLNPTVNKTWTFTKHNGQLYCLPTFYLMGYPKCGTTTVCDLLSKHALIGTSLQWLKRWIDLDNIQTIVPVFIRYISKFEGIGKKIERNPANSLVGDCAVSNAFQLPFSMNLSTTFPDANPYLVHSLLPHAKFIAVMRNPLYRIRSEYYFFLRMHCRDRAEEVKRLSDADSFHLTITNHLSAYEKCMKLHADIVFCMYSYRNWIQPESTCIQVRLETTMYFYTLSQWLQYYPREQFLIIRTEDLKESEATVAADMYSFIGAGTFSNQELEKEEQSMKEKKAQSFLYVNSTEEDFMHPKTRKLLLDFFHPHNVKLAKLLQDDRFLWLE